MSRILLARRQLRRLRAGGDWRSYAAGFALVGALVGYSEHRVGQGSVAASDLASGLASVLVLVVPLAAVAFAADTVAGERERGRLRLALSLPHDRGAFFEGTVAGRAGAFAALAVGAPLAALAVTLALGSRPDLLAVTLFGCLTALFAAATAALVVGISAAAATTNRTLAVSLGGFLGLGAWWSAGPNLLALALTGSSAMVYPYPWWATFTERLTPMGAYEGLVTALGPVGTEAAGEVPLLLSPWVSVAVLLGWGLLGLAVGRFWFRRAAL